MQEKLSELENKYKDSLRTLRELHETNDDVKCDIEDLEKESKAWWVACCLVDLFYLLTIAFSDAVIVEYYSNGNIFAPSFSK